MVQFVALNANVPSIWCWLTTLKQKHYIATITLEMRFRVLCPMNCWNLLDPYSFLLHMTGINFHFPNFPAVDIYCRHIPV